VASRKKKTPKTARRPTASSERKLAAPSEVESPAKLTILTIGHSTRPIEEFLELLRAHRVERLVDVRSIPKSRHVPQFNSDLLAASLKGKGVDYIHMKSLGGRRHGKKDSVNLGWRNESFRGYADYMASEEFRAGLARLLEMAREKRTAIMCAEAVPWRCHRSLVGDALLVRGVRVQDIMSATSAKSHELTPFAQVRGQDVIYPAEFKQGKLQLA
jgi:uncharacterized protein (DUF488 family)